MKLSKESFVKKNQTFMPKVSGNFRMKFWRKFPCRNTKCWVSSVVTPLVRVVTTDNAIMSLTDNLLHFLLFHVFTSFILRNIFYVCMVPYFNYSAILSANLLQIFCDIVLLSFYDNIDTTIHNLCLYHRLYVEIVVKLNIWFYIALSLANSNLKCIYVLCTMIITLGCTHGRSLSGTRGGSAPPTHDDFIMG